MIYLVAILLFSMTPGAVIAQGLEWYSSDGAAIRYAETSEQSGLASEWALSIQKTSDTERTVHYRDGQAVTSWIRSLDASGLVHREAVEKDGEITEERLFAAGQQLLLERFFLPDGSVEEIKYIRDDGRLVMSTQLKDGIETGSRVYLYYPDGRLAGIRDQTSTNLMSTGTERSKSARTTSWTNTSDGLILSIHDNAGRLVESRIYQGAVLASIEKRLWFDGRLISLSTELPEDGVRVVLVYDKSGKLESRTETKDTDLIGFYEFEYDLQDRLILENRETPGKQETIEYIHDSAGTLLSETRILNGLMVLSRTYIEPDEMFEEYYDKNKLFARIQYKGGRKVRETILSDGNIVRERNF